MPCSIDNGLDNTNIKIVPQSKAYVIERLGTYSTTWETGLHFKIPFIEKVARVVVPDDKLSLAIGKDGQNARLAARLTGWKIDVKSESKARLEEEALLGVDAEEVVLGRIERDMDKYFVAFNLVGVNDIL